jgi:flagellar hook assembly protein FlgD
VASGLTTASYDPGLLQANRRYYWKVKATDPSGETSVGRLVCFVTGSGVAGEPADVAMAQTLQITGMSALPTRGGQASVQFTLSAAASVSVRILNTAGRPVRTVCEARNCDGGTNLMLWNCRTDGGLSAPNGTYLVEMTAASPDGSRSRVITTVRLQR